MHTLSSIAVSLCFFFVSSSGFGRKNLLERWPSSFAGSWDWGEPRVCSGNCGLLSATCSLGLTPQSICGGCGRPWGSFRKHQGELCSWVAQAGTGAHKAPSATVTPLPRGVFPEARSPTMSHCGAPTREHDIPAPVAFSRLLLSAQMR